MYILEIREDKNTISEKILITAFMELFQCYRDLYLVPLMLEKEDCGDYNLYRFSAETSGSFRFHFHAVMRESMLFKEFVNLYFQNGNTLEVFEYVFDNEGNKISENTKEIYNMEQLLENNVPF